MIKKDEKGFTLIERLVVVAIIGIVAAIAIPQFAEYRQRAFNSRAVSDLRNGITAQEAYYVDEEDYVTCASPCADLPGFTQSSGVTTGFTNGGDGTFTGTSTHDQGNLDYSWDSSTGVIESA